MVDATLDALLEKACATPLDCIRATHLLDQLEKMAAAYTDPNQRPAVEATVAAWQSGEDELRKGISMAFLARARSMLGRAGGHAATTAGKMSGAHAAGRAFNRAAGRAGDIGAMAGEKIARSPLGARSMANAKAVGGAAAQERMAQRLQPNPSQNLRSPRFLEDAHPSARLEPQAPAMGTARPMPGRNFGAEQAANAGGTTSGLADPAARTAAAHANALNGAFRAGASFAADAHAGKVAAHGRVAARYAFKTGMKFAGVAGAVAAAGTAERLSSGGSLSEAQHEQRVAAGKRSHQGRGTAAAA